MVGLQQQSPTQAKAQKADFSRTAVSRAVLASTLQKPYVLYPASVGLLGTAAAILLGPAALFVIPAVAGGALGLGAWAFDFFMRRDYHASTYLKRLTGALHDRRVQTVRDLDRELAEVGSEGAREQLKRLERKYDAFASLLGKKLNPEELTYGRYMGMAEQVFLSALDNLQHIADTLASVRAIDTGFVDRRIRVLEQTAEPDSAEQQELESLRIRLGLEQEQQGRVQGWLAQNEQAMTQMDLTMAAIASMETIRGHAGTDMETAMRALGELARRTSEYNLHGGSGNGT